jgi:hypothetical protein
MPPNQAAVRDVAVPIAPIAVFAAVVATIVDTGWSGAAPVAVLIVLHVALGLVVARWWVLLAPPAVWTAVVVTSPRSGSEDLSGVDLEAFAIIVFALGGAALVAVGVLARQVLGKRLTRA